jgi:hypothetical protein
MRSAPLSAGIWHYELTTEDLSRRSLQLRQLDLRRASEALSAALPPNTAAALAPLVAQLSAPELRRIVAIAPHLTADHAATLDRAARLDAVPAAATLQAVLDDAAHKAALQEWLGGDGGARPLELRRDSFEASLQDIKEDLIAAIRHQAAWERCAVLFALSSSHFTLEGRNARMAPRAPNAPPFSAPEFRAIIAVGAHPTTDLVATLAHAARLDMLATAAPFNAVLETRGGAPGVALA